MKGKFQGQNELIINASINNIWKVLIDGRLLTEWMPVVKQTTSVTESLDAVRHCEVEMNGKKGKVSEKCVLFKDKKEIGWEMLSDEFGFDKMFKHYGFSFELIPLEQNKTRIINRGFGNPKNIFIKMLNVLMMKRIAAKMRKQALNGIKIVAERYETN